MDYYWYNPGHDQASRYVMFHKTHLGTETQIEPINVCDYGNIRGDMYTSSVINL